MSEAEGLLADATPESADDNQPQEESITHLEAGDPRLEPEKKGDDGSEEPEKSAAAEPTERPEWYPEKFWGKDGPDMENLVKSYRDLEKKFSQGKHKAPEEYSVELFEQAAIPPDDPLYNSYKNWAKENKISQEAFDQLAGEFIAIAGKEQQEAQLSYQEEYKSLGANADAVIKSMSQWGQSLVSKGVWSESDFDEFKIMGGTAQGLRALQKVRSYYGDRSVPVNVDPVGDTPSKDDLNAMVGRPEYQTDPAYRKKVEKMFERVYGTEEYVPA
tara:strand:- start:1287 stop:2105 length:819 start_codon:yes stop_codon:yes gene_type:complete